MLHAPKPAATFCGFAADGLGFFQVPYDKPVKPPVREVATTLIHIKEGSVPADLLKRELARLVPVKWPWMVQEHKEGFLVLFPNKTELQCLLAVKEVRTDQGEGIMLFQEWEHKIEPQQLLKKVWVNVYDVPYEI
uniref:DUF4283 domain-containing protein n=1 Tax=Arundo donax TaxID=35708 RepID=A0A0A9H1S6_ARUDO